MKNKNQESIYHWLIFVTVASLFTVILYGQSSIFLAEQDELRQIEDQSSRIFWDN